MLQTSMTHIAMNMVVVHHIGALICHNHKLYSWLWYGNNDKENGNEHDTEVPRPPLFSYILFSGHKFCRSMCHDRMID